MKFQKSINGLNSDIFENFKGGFCFKMLYYGVLTEKIMSKILKSRNGLKSRKKFCVGTVGKVAFYPLKAPLDAF